MLELEEEDNYRISILKNVPIFGILLLFQSIIALKFIPASLSRDALLLASKSMTKEYFVKGDQIIRQNEMGESFYILQDGLLLVTVCKIINQKNQK
jgi:CRP-like cAMP-binding protein